MEICGDGLENPDIATYPGGMSILSENIRSLRERFVNQTEFGEKVGVGQSTVVRWEKGSDPKPDNLLALARLADVSIEQLITMPLSAIPARKAGDPLPSEADFAQMVSAAMQEVPPGSRLVDYPPIVASSLRDQLGLFLRHGGFQGSSDAPTAPDKAAQPRAPTKAREKGEPRTP